jgi:hypothetical protein
MYHVESGVNGIFLKRKHAAKLVVEGVKNMRTHLAVWFVFVTILLSGCDNKQAKTNVQQTVLYTPSPVALNPTPSSPTAQRYNKRYVINVNIFSGPARSTIQKLKRGDDINGINTRIFTWK